MSGIKLNKYGESQVFETRDGDKVFFRTTEHGITVMHAEDGAPYPGAYYMYFSSVEVADEYVMALQAPEASKTIINKLGETVPVSELSGSVDWFMEYSAELADAMMAEATTESVHVVCAWCDKPMDSNTHLEKVSHSICEPCAEKELKKSEQDDV